MQATVEMISAPVESIRHRLPKIELEGLPAIIHQHQPAAARKIVLPASIYPEREAKAVTLSRNDRVVQQNKVDAASLAEAIGKVSRALPGMWTLRGYIRRRAVA